MKTSILLLFPSLGKGMSLKCFHLSLICRQMMGFIQPQMLLDVFDTMTVSTRPSTLSKPISMVADIKFTFWPIATLIITKKKKTLIITFSFPQSNPLFLYHILVNIRRITAFVQETEKVSVPMFQNLRNSTQGNTPLCMFVYSFTRTELVSLSHGRISLPLDRLRSHFLLMKWPVVSVLASVISTLSTPRTLITKVPFPQAAVTQSKFLRRLPLLSMFFSLEHITFPNWSRFSSAVPK